MLEARTNDRAADRKNRFDQTDRNRIRRSLLRYMEANRIGVPTLQKEIATANGLPLDRVPLKTLQRFLADTHRSNDAMVRFCHVFADLQPDDDPLADVGEALASFYTAGQDGIAEQVPPNRLASHYSGWIGGRLLSALAHGYSSQQREWVPYSQLTIDSPGGRPFCPVLETVTNWHCLKTFDHTSCPRRTYEGILFHPPGALLAVMRNCLTGAPRVYWLFDGAEDTLAGLADEHDGSFASYPGPSDSLVNRAMVLFTPAPDEAAS